MESELNRQIPIHDAQGNSLTGATREAVLAFDRAVNAFHFYRGDPVAEADAAIATAPRFVMAHILKAWMYGLATEPAATAGAKAIVQAASEMPANAREASHLRALGFLMQGEWTAAATTLDQHLMRWPRDIVALQAGHLTDFYRANARDLRDRIARALPEWSADLPGYSAVLGMFSFGLEEAGDYARAEDIGREAIDRDPRDSWAHHAVAHVMEMQGRATEGIAWMEDRAPHWADDSSFFRVHNWWHKALYHLDLGQTEEALALYDAKVRETPSGMALDLVDASALLWRLTLTGISVGDRWQEVATAWDAHADGKLYPFNDWHAAMAYLGAGREDEVDRILTAYSSAREGEIGVWARTTGSELIRGFRDFWQGSYGDAATRLHKARYIANSFGGSHAQRDVIDWTATEAALRGGLGDAGRALANERLAMKPHSPMNRLFLERADSI